jgi:hypothetical protein
VVQINEKVEVKWVNKIPTEGGYLITGKDNTALGAGEYSGMSVVDTSAHYAYSMKGYTQYSIEEHGTPIVPHLHGGHSDFAFDGNPEYFFTPEFKVKGPQWTAEVYEYDNTQAQAGCLWIHDHALGM